MGLVMDDVAGLDPFLYSAKEPVVSEVDAPDRRIFAAHLRKAGVQPEEADQAGPLAVEVGHGQHRAAVGPETREDVMAVLPHPLGDDQGSLRRYALEHRQPGPLAVDEAMALDRVEVMGAVN